MVRAGVILMVLLVAACTERGAITVVPSAAGVGTVEEIFVGTSRAVDASVGEDYSFLRDTSVRYARVDVSIPPERETGQIVWPRADRTPDPLTEFVALSQVTYPDEAAFRAALRKSVASHAKSGSEAFVFVHGFNNNFAESTYRTAQLAHDLDVDATLVHYAWPSRASALGYVYDRDSAIFGRDALEQLIRDVESSGTRRFVLVGHSMGCFLVMETLRQIAISGDRRILDRIAGVILLSPDIDIDVFREQASRIGELPQPFIIFTSQRDKALRLSARITGEPDRLGNLQNPAILGDLKVTLIDTTAFSTGSGHFNVGESPALIALLDKIGSLDAALSADQAGKTSFFGGIVLSVQNATKVVLSPVAALAN